MSKARCGLRGLNSLLCRKAQGHKGQCDPEEDPLDRHRLRQPGTPPPKAIPKRPPTKASVLSDVKYQKRVLAGQWEEIVKRLQFQLPVKDADGLPSNIHLLDTLRGALALYQQMAAWSHVESKLKRP